MLKLRKVEILGFKSFCERTTVTFSGSGTTCIVGPNGCGKSNVVDAISWVLGEQSHKSLRAERMADCIFNGTVKRPPLGLAEVTITMEDPELAEAARFVLENADAEPNAIEIPMRETPEPSSDAPEMLSPDAAAPVNELEAPVVETIEPETKKRRRKSGDRPVLATKPGEVVVSRRLYRSGQSEYLINGRPARLRDIQEMFMGVGLGPDSYAIIEQGRIGMILSTKPMERRAIIEEAAGVTKFKTKKRLAEAKLESSKVNLSRVNDIVVEVEKQLGSLKRQAAKARRYSEVREQMRGIVRQMLAGKARELDAEAERISASLAEITASETQHAQGIAQKEGEQDRLNQRIYSLDAELRQNQNVLNQTALEVDRSENRIAFNQTRCAELSGRREQITSELAQVLAQAADCSARVLEQERSLAAARAEAATLHTRVEELAARSASRAAEILASEKKIEELRRAAALAGESLLQIHGEQKQAEEALIHQGEALRKLEIKEASLMESSVQLREDAERAAKDWQFAMGQLAALNQKASEMETSIAELREKREAATAESNSLRDSLASVRARHSTLTEILDDHSYTANAVQKLFAVNEGGGAHDFHAVGVLADYAEVEEKHEAAIEQYLREELEYVVVQTYDHAR
ncbi:MAG TPA: AAA family ATPase, partial [Candidatus Eremiobacteraceae bacterium]|nr:AAA family ATPase [Candidatus Eremiobacteraceae bacterium]